MQKLWPKELECYPFPTPHLTSFPSYYPLTLHIRKWTPSLKWVTSQALPFQNQLFCCARFSTQTMPTTLSPTDMEQVGSLPAPQLGHLSPNPSPTLGWTGVAPCWKTAPDWLEGSSHFYCGHISASKRARTESAAIRTKETFPTDGL